MKSCSQILCLAAVVGIACGGCKSAPKLAWWKKDAPEALAAAETDAATANGKPVDPADAAKLAGSNSAGDALPFVPNLNAVNSAPGKNAPQADSLVAAATAPAALTSAAGSTTGMIGSGAYPSTGKPPVSPSAAVAAVASATRTASAQASGALGAMDLPYDPQAVPGGAGGASLAASRAPSTSNGGRYEIPGATASTAGRSDAYGLASSASSTIGAVTSGANDATQAAQNEGDVARLAGRYGVPSGIAGNVAEANVGTLGGRYAASSNVVAPPSSYAERNATDPSPYGVGDTSPNVESDSLVAAATAPPIASQPYRPGGTSTYPTGALAPGGSTSGPIEMASRPSRDGSSFGTSSTPTGYPSSGSAASGPSPYSSVPFAPAVPSAPNAAREPRADAPLSEGSTSGGSATSGSRAPGSATFAPTSGGYAPIVPGAPASSGQGGEIRRY